MDVDVREPGTTISGTSRSESEEFGPELANGLFTMELCEDIGYCAPMTTDPTALDRSLRIVKVLSREDGRTMKRLIVRVAFDSFIEPLREMGLLKGN